MCCPLQIHYFNDVFYDVSHGDGGDDDGESQLDDGYVYRLQGFYDGDDGESQLDDGGVYRLQGFYDGDDGES